MTTFEIIMLIIGIVLFSGAIAGFIATSLFARKIYLKHLKRGYYEEWGRGCSDPKDPEQVIMYDDGIVWGKEHESYKEEVKIVNEGLNLFGEYFDFGFERAVIIISGRMEGCTYGYYFAPPYKKAGYNLLVIDQRAHGLSDGEYNTLGKNEYRDIIAWSDFLIKEKNVKSIVLHGICIGAATGLYAIIDDKCPCEISAIVTEGMYPSFYESFKNHMIKDNHPLFPVLQECNMWMKLYTGKDMKHGPDSCIDRLEKPILMLQSMEDLFSKPDKAQMMFDLCPSKSKKIVYFEHGEHSHLRYTAKKKYDDEIIAFLNENLA